MKSPYLKRLKIIHFALCSACVLFMFATYFSEKYNMSINTPLKTINYIGFIAASLLLVSTAIFMKRTSQIPESADTDTKKQLYQQAFIIALAIIEGACLFNITIAAVTNNLINLLVAILLLFNLITKMPTYMQVSQLAKIPIDEI